MAAIIDKYFNKFISRKLIVWLAATGLMYNSTIDADNWVTLSLIYIGSQAAVDITKAIKGLA